MNPNSVKRVSEGTVPDVFIELASTHINFLGGAQ